jgi:uncharacterized membrane protein YeaQ/YmgE (transglycosylase-associated protein family)
MLSGGSMRILMWIIFGLIAGTGASLIMPAGASRDIYFTIAFGVMGAMIGGFIGMQVQRPFVSK